MRRAAKPRRKATPPPRDPLNPLLFDSREGVMTVVGEDGRTAFPPRLSPQPQSSEGKPMLAYSRTSSESRSPTRDERTQAAVRIAGKRRKVLQFGWSPRGDPSNSSGFGLSFRYQVGDPRAQPDNHREVEQAMRSFTLRAGRGERGVGQEAADYIVAASESIGVDSFVAHMSLRMFAQNMLVEETEVLAGRMVEAGILRPGIEYYDSLLKAYCRGGHIEKAFQTFDKMEEVGIPRWPYQFADLILAYGRAGNEAAAFALFKRMRGEGHVVDFTVSLALLTACKSLPPACRVVRMMQALGLHANSISVYTALAGVALRAERYGLCQKVMRTAESDPLCDPLDAMAYNLLLHCCAKQAKAARFQGDTVLQRLILLESIALFGKHILPHVGNEDNLRAVMKSSVKYFMGSCWALSRSPDDTFSAMFRLSEQLFL